MKRLIVYRDSLMLNGVRHADRHAVAVALQREPAQLPSDPKTAACMAALGDASRLWVGAILLDPGSEPQRSALDAARGIGEEMKI